MLNPRCSESKKSEQEESINDEIIEGLLFIENVRNIRFENDSQLTIVIRRFWLEDVISKSCVIENKINLLEHFSVVRSNAFLQKVINNHLLIELHQTNNKVIGIAKLPLHQFYIAFKDSEITNRLFQEILPVISIDDWVPVLNPVSNDCYGYLKSFLAMGTSEQINNLKLKRGLTLISSSQNSQTKSLNNYCEITNITKLFTENHSKPKYNGISSNHLGNFIENLIQQRNLHALTKGTTLNNINDETNSRKLQTRKTSDLLDTLNKALLIPPSESDMFSLCFDQFSTPPTEIPKVCKVLIEIERAVDLPRNTMKIGNKKISRRSPNGGGSKRKQSRFATEEEPSAYVTFHAAVGYGQMVKSHEGFVYVTNVVERNCNPTWGKKFEVPVPLELFTNVEKRFILKVWRKVATDLAQRQLQPLPMEDIVIGFSSVDLNSLTTRNQITEWYNIVDHNGRIHGRLKIKIESLDDLDSIKQKIKEIQRLKNSCQIGTNGINWNCNSIDFNNTPLSRAIKRKFTELEEITERLKARLLGVTGDLKDEDADQDPALEAQLDEFEHDLNTACEEDDEDFERYKNCDWLSSWKIQPTSERERDTFDNIKVQIKIDSQKKIQVATDVLSKADLINEISLQQTEINMIPNVSAAINNSETNTNTVESNS